MMLIQHLQHNVRAKLEAIPYSLQMKQTHFESSVNHLMTYFIIHIYISGFQPPHSCQQQLSFLINTLLPQNYKYVIFKLFYSLHT